MFLNFAVPELNALERTWFFMINYLIEKEKKDVCDCYLFQHERRGQSCHTKGMAGYSECQFNRNNTRLDRLGGYSG